MLIFASRYYSQQKANNVALKYLIECECILENLETDKEEIDKKETNNNEVIEEDKEEVVEATEVEKIEDCIVD